MTYPKGSTTQKPILPLAPTACTFDPRCLHCKVLPFIFPPPPSPSSTSSHGGGIGGKLGKNGYNGGQRPTAELSWLKEREVKSPAEDPGDFHSTTR